MTDEPAATQDGSAPVGSAQGELRGYDLARSALEEARAAAKAAGKSVGQGRSSPVKRTSSKSGSRRRWSGSGPDSRDPQPLGRLTTSIASQRGWQPHIGQGRLFGMWESIVGVDIAAHAKPTVLSDKVLHIQAESTAWATQLRYVQSTILAKIAGAVGEGIVTSVRITGPAAPSWRKGPRHVRGRGPRDTYG